MSLEAMAMDGADAIQGNYVDDKFQDRIYHANYIKLEIADSLVTSELTFRGVQHLQNWFRSENLISSSLWEISSSDSDLTFTFGYDAHSSFKFQILSQQNDCWESSSGFFLFAAPTDSNCPPSENLVVFASSRTAVELMGAPKATSLSLYVHALPTYCWT